MQRIFTFSIIILLYVTIYLLIPKDSFWIRDCGNKFLILKEYLETGKKNCEIPYPGKIVDTNLNFFPINYPFAHNVKGKFYSQYPFNSFILISSYLFKAFNFHGLYILSIASSLILLFLISNKFMLFKQNPIYLFTLFTGTPMFFYSFTFWEHSFAILFLYLGLYFYMKRKDDFKNIILSAVSFTLAISLREENILWILSLILLSIFMQTFKNNFKKNISLVLLILFSLIISNTTNTLLNHYIINVQGKINIVSFLKQRILVMNNLLFANHYISHINKINIILLLTMILAQFRFRKKINSVINIYSSFILFAILSMFFIEDFSKHLLYGNGILITFPIFFILYINLKNKSIQKYQVLISTYIILTVFFCPFISSFGIHWGPRMLLSIIPLVTITVFRIANKIQLKKITVYYICIISIILQTLSIIMIYDRKKQTEKLIIYLSNKKNIPIITTIPWISEDLAPIFHKNKIFYIKTAKDLALIKNNLKKHNFHSAFYISFLSKNDKSDSKSFTSPLKKFAIFDSTITRINF